MENEGVNISSVSLVDDKIIVSYENGATETLVNCHETYVAMYNKWLVPNPPFISDKHKACMRNISFCALNGHQKCMSEMHCFFEPGNEQKVKDFLTYMRARPALLPQMKQGWSFPSA